MKATQIIHASGSLAPIGEPGARRFLVKQKIKQSTRPMTTQEHLEKIKAKCQQLLAIAEKRTQGDWQTRKCPCGHPKCSDTWPGPMKGVQGSGYHPSDAAYIASCAGPAEAGWRATIAAINLIQQIRSHDDGGDCDALVEVQANHIAAAWPEESL